MGGSPHPTIEHGQLGCMRRQSEACWQLDPEHQYLFPMQKQIAEFLGTLWLVLGGCGSAVLAAAFPEVGIGLGVALARSHRAHHGLCHRAHQRLPPEPGGHHRAGGRGGRFPKGGPRLHHRAGPWRSGRCGHPVATPAATALDLGGFAANGGTSPGGYGMVSALLCEVVMTAFFPAHHRQHRRPRSRWFRAHRHRSGPLRHPPDPASRSPTTSVESLPAPEPGPCSPVANTLAQVWLFWVAPMRGCRACRSDLPGLSGQAYACQVQYLTTRSVRASVPLTRNR